MREKIEVKKKRKIRRTAGREDESEKRETDRRTDGDRQTDRQQWFHTNKVRGGGMFEANW